MTHPLTLRIATRFAFALSLAALAFPGCTTNNTAATNPAVQPAGQKSVAGRWVAQFDTQLGIQSYTFDFKLAGTTLTGTAVGQVVDQPARDPIVLTECTLTGNAIHFVETRDNNGTPLRIEYTGTVTGDTMPLKRTVNDTTGESTAKRAI